MRDDDRSRINYKKLAGLSSLGLMLPSSIAVGLFIGYYLDKLLGTRPWLLVLFFLFGTASGFYSLIRGLKKYLDKDKDM
ncbi:MAG: AtpZ/AtpI family protein [Candidatus Aminicenantes bacterium]|nr:AtpZ/AtpI family protein [Candidatus Aminicenantes bacterium]